MTELLTDRSDPMLTGPRELREEVRIDPFKDREEPSLADPLRERMEPKDRGDAKDAAAALQEKHNVALRHSPGQQSQKPILPFAPPPLNKG